MHSYSNAYINRLGLAGLLSRDTTRVIKKGKAMGLLKVGQTLGLDWGVTSPETEQVSCSLSTLRIQLQRDYRKGFFKTILGSNSIL